MKVWKRQRLTCTQERLRANGFGNNAPPPQVDRRGEAVM